MSSEYSVSTWIDRLRRDDPAAAQALWDRYCSRLYAVARGRLAARWRRMAAEEDVVQSAFGTFCRRAAEGQFPELHDRHDLWRLLVRITERKAADLARRENAVRRGGGQPPLTLADPAVAPASPEPTPEFAAQTAEELERLLGRLGSEDLRTVAVLALEGYDQRDIAEKLRCGLRTVERRFQQIRLTWQKENDA